MKSEENKFDPERLQRACDSNRRKSPNTRTSSHQMFFFFPSLPFLLLKNSKTKPTNVSLFQQHGHSQLVSEGIFFVLSYFTRKSHCDL